jgi:hypothetical protein
MSDVAAVMHRISLAERSLEQAVMHFDEGDRLYGMTIGVHDSTWADNFFGATGQYGRSVKRMSKALQHVEDLLSVDRLNGIRDAIKAVEIETFNMNRNREPNRTVFESARTQIQDALNELKDVRTKLTQEQSKVTVEDVTAVKVSTPDAPKVTPAPEAPVVEAPEQELTAGEQLPRL